MTEMASTPRRRRLSTRAVSLRLVAASFLASAAIGGGLAIQMANGHDPALGAGTTKASSGSSQSQAGGFGDDESDGFDQSQSESGFDQGQSQSDVGQSASTPGSVTSRAS
jgi:hypothetical protein